jgi:hypothetical protein
LERLNNDISTWSDSQKRAKIQELENRKDKVIADCYEEVRKITVLIARLQDSMRNTIDGR